MQEKDSKKAKHGKRSKSSKQLKSRRESSPESGSGSGSDSGGGKPAGRKPQGGLQVELARARHAARCTRELLLQYPEQRRDLRQVLPSCCAALMAGDTCTVTYLLLTNRLSVPKIGQAAYMRLARGL